MRGRQLACTCAGLIIIGTGYASAARGQARSPSPAPAPPPPAAAQPSPPDHDIVVLANPAERRSLDRTTYVVRDTAEARSSNVLEVLDRVPSLEVTASGQLRLLGRTGVRIQIDGQDVANPQAVLRSLQGSQVARIEVISNPSAQFSAQGTGGIVNIILRRTFASGIGGSATGSAGSYGGYNVRLSPTWSRGPFSVSGSVGRYRIVYPADLESRRTSTDPGSGAVSENFESGSRRIVSRNINGNLIATWRPSARQSLTITGTAAHYDGLSSGHSQLVSSLNPGNTVRQTYAGTSNLDARDLALDYRRESSRQGESLTVSAKRSTSQYLSDSVYSSDSALSGPGILAIRTEGSTRIDNAKLDYVLPFARERRLAFGGLLQRQREDQLLEQDGRLPLTGDPFSNASAIAGSWTERAAYLTYQSPLLGGTILAGLRIEDRSFTLEGVSGPLPGGAHLMPSLHFERRLTPALTTGLSYSRRIEWPSIIDLSPALRFSDSTSARAGNPALRPELTDSFEFKLGAQLAGQSLELTAFSRRTGGYNSNLAEVNGDGILVTRPVTLGSNLSRGANLSLRGPLGSGFSYSAEANVSRERINHAGTTAAFIRSDVQYSASVTIEFRDGTEGRRNADHIELRARYFGPQDLAFLRGSSIVSTNASWSHAFTDRLSSVVSVSEFLGPQASRFRYVTDTTVSRQFEQRGAPRVTVSLTFSLAPPRR